MPKDNFLQFAVTVFAKNGDVLKRTKPSVTEKATAHKIGRKLMQKLGGTDYTVIEIAQPNDNE